MNTITVDAAGGDHYPEVPVAGAVEAVKAQNDLKVVLCGPQETVASELKKHEYDTERISIQHAPQIIGMDEVPAQAVKTKQESSIVTALKLQAAGKSQAFVSAGNTGALLAASTLILGKLEGISRPTIGAIFPTIKGSRLLVDAGANLEMKDEMFAQFAQMGRIYAREIMEVSDPQVGLLNVGSEEGKGTEQLKAVSRKLKNITGFAGNFEGDDIFTAHADVFVCNGLVGNLLLKMGESIPQVLKKFIGSTVKKMNLDEQEMQLVMGVLKRSLQEFNPDNVGGIPFLGVDGVSMVGHGSSTAVAVKNMIFNAVRCVEDDLNEKIVSSLN